MSGKYASNSKAHGFCDRCGFRVKLADMKTERVRGRPLNNKVCPSCYDEDHPQNWLGAFPVTDPQALRDPRPDPALEASRQIPDNS
jgi:hypothetical protein